MKALKIFKIQMSVLFYAVLATACTHVIKPPEKMYADYAPQEKINLTIGLNISEELRQAKWENHSMGDTWVIPVGEWVASNSMSLANHVFTSVLNVSGKSRDPSLMVDAILTPRVAFINRTVGATSFGKSIITVKVEWDMRTPDGNPIWVETVSGEASGSTGWTDPEEILEKALNNLQSNSQKAFSSSQAIACFASTQ